MGGRPELGQPFLPRIGSEVLVEFLHGDIDQPRITGQLYNGEVAPPFGGPGRARQPPGTLSGLHTSPTTAAAPSNAAGRHPGQLRTRCTPRWPTPGWNWATWSP
uniref:phage baseplate assembly protein V n=1 Tax=Xanthomonas oryzae TaxID=347 RepID=UPI003D9FB469